MVRDRGAVDDYPIESYSIILGGAAGAVVGFFVWALAVLPALDETPFANLPTVLWAIVAMASFAGCLSVGVAVALVIETAWTRVSTRARRIAKQASAD